MAKFKSAFIKYAEKKARENANASAPGFFKRSADRLLDLVVDHWQVMCGALLVGSLSWQIYSGMYDLNAVTTIDLQRNRAVWSGRDVTLSNVTIAKHEIREVGKDTLLRLWVVNGNTNPPAGQDSLLVLGRMSTSNARRFQSLPWSLRNYKTSRLAQARIKLTTDYALLKQYSLPLDVSWFDTPYWLTVSTVNRFASLTASVYAGVAVQVITYVIVAFLVWIGLVYILPNLG